MCYLTARGHKARCMARRHTLRVPLPGGSVSAPPNDPLCLEEKRASAFFGRTKLNKILWKSDFEAFSDRGRPVTGRDYQRLEHGPAPKEMLPLYREMMSKGLGREEVSDFGYRVWDHAPES